jgi:hypothetical protein
LIGSRHTDRVDYSSVSVGINSQNDCKTCAVHEEYEQYLKNQIKSLEATINLLVKPVSNPVEPEIVPQELPRRRNFKDIQRELVEKHKVQTKETGTMETVNG